VLGYTWGDVEGPEEELRQTRNAQPAIFLHSYALFQMLSDPQPAMAAGHSLGEYTALAVANALTFDDALRLVQLRAQAMWDAGVETPGTMAAIIGLDDAVVDELCRVVSQEFGVSLSEIHYDPAHVVLHGAYESSQPRDALQTAWGT
jgi:[acyl-carrier-protein] S-malonyltransferase